MQRTLAMIKPDAVATAGAAQAIMAKIEAAGFTITRRRQYTLYPTQAEEFYAEHANKPFFSKLIDFMTSGPIWALELQVCCCVALVLLVVGILSHALLLLLEELFARAGSRSCQRLAHINGPYQHSESPVGGPRMHSCKVWY
jgi:nucleoside diphosphate kinase